MPNAAPYKIEKRGDKFVVLNNAGEVKATFKTHAQALDYLQALYKNVPGAQKKASKTPWTGKQKAAATPEELAARWAPTLGRRRSEAATEAAPAAVTSTTSVITTTPVVVPEPTAMAVEGARAFTTEVNGKTILTAPASALEDRQLAAAGNKHFLWVHGRFVGAEEPNRNNAYWSSGDLELGQSSVANGPLNWLHEARHVIGTIAKADFIPGATAGVEAAAETVHPHITATSAVWKWIWPDEAWVLEQASDAGKLWFSMECISDSVKCRAEGCETEVAYAAYLNDLGCSHMTQRSSVRHFANPTFLGGAVIVPPARPGWADADASIMTQAASMAEKAFDQAGRPDVATSEWELLMGQVLAYAKE